MSATEFGSRSDEIADGVTEADPEAADSNGDGSGVDAAPGGTRRAPAEGANEPAVLSRDVIFDILKNERRRRVLEFLRDDPTTTLSDLAEHVAALENDKPIRELTSSERKRVYVGLYQCHLPKMADAGVIDYDRSRGTVELRDSTSEYFLHLDIDPTEDHRSGFQLVERLSEALSSLSSVLSRR